MIKIIDGKRYNTDTATEIADYGNGLGTSDFRNIWEVLYLTPKGAWFMKYSGGAMTRYSESCGNNSWCGSKGIRALSADEAFEWLQEHDETEALEKYFSDKLQDA
jgi:hypothetical protein